MHRSLFFQRLYDTNQDLSMVSGTLTTYTSCKRRGGSGGSFVQDHHAPGDLDRLLDSAIRFLWLVIR